MAKVMGYTGRLFLAIVLGLVLLGFSPIKATAAPNPVDLELGGSGATSWNITNLKPTDNGTKAVTLHNAGTTDGFVTIWLSDIVNNEGANPESETGNTAEPGEMIDHLLLNLTADNLNTNLNLPTTINNLPQSTSWPYYLDLIPLKVGDTVDLQWAWELPAQTNNDAQGDGISFTINYLLREVSITDVSGVVTAEGLFTEEVTIAPEGINGKLTIRENTTGLTESGDPLSEIWFIEIDKEPSAPSADTTTVGPHYNIGPDGATFDQPATLTITYDPAAIPARTDEEELVIVLWDEDAGGWVEVAGSTVDWANNIISAPVSHFSRYTIIAPVHPPPPPFFYFPPPPAPAAFSLSNLTAEPAKVQPQEAVTITVSVTNTGGTEGNYTVVLKLNGVKEAQQTVTIAAGSSQIVTFSVTGEQTGSYTVTVDGLSASFTVANVLAVTMPDREASIEIGPDGILSEPFTLSGRSGEFFIDIDSGTRVIGARDTELSRIELRVTDQLITVPDNIVILSPIYQVTGYTRSGDAIGINFDPPVLLTIRYKPEDLPENTFLPFIANYTDELGLIRLQPPPETTVRIGRVQALINHASLFVVAAEVLPPPPPLPAKFKASSLIINPRQPQLDQPITISVTIANEGEVTGSFELHLIIDGIVRAVQEVTLSGKSRETLTFEVTNLTAGQHQVKIAGLSEQFRIVRITTPLEGLRINWLIFDISVGIALVIGALILYLITRRSHKRRFS